MAHIRITFGNIESSSNSSTNNNNNCQAAKTKISNESSIPYTPRMMIIPLVRFLCVQCTYSAICALERANVRERPLTRSCYYFSFSLTLQLDKMEHTDRKSNVITITENARPFGILVAHIKCVCAVCLQAFLSVSTVLYVDKCVYFVWYMVLVHLFFLPPNSRTRTYSFLFSFFSL